MSTRCSLAYGKGYHLYEDVLEDGVVHLEINCNLEQFSFEASPLYCDIAIPREAWEAIRGCASKRTGGGKGTPFCGGASAMGAAAGPLGPGKR